MTLLNDISRCEGVKNTALYRIERERFEWTCSRTCARYVERNTGGPRTMTYSYLCDEGDMYIPAEKPNEN